MSLCEALELGGRCLQHLLRLHLEVSLQRRRGACCLDVQVRGLLLATPQPIHLNLETTSHALSGSVGVYIRSTPQAAGILGPPICFARIV